MKLLLSGGGNPDKVKPLDELFKKEVNKDAKVLYIPIAWVKGPYQGCLDWFKSIYGDHFNNITMAEDLSNIDLDNYDAIFIGGGNTYKLLKHIKETKFDEKLIKFVKDNKFVYGGSAGAIIFGKTMKTANHLDPNDVGLVDLNALNIVDKDIWPHFKESDLDRINNYKESLYILYEESGLYFEDDKVISIGKESFVYMKDNKLTDIETATKVR
jgi:dipeptidase E